MPLLYSRSNEVVNQLGPPPHEGARAVLHALFGEFLPARASPSCANLRCQYHDCVVGNCAILGKGGFGSSVLVLTNLEIGTRAQMRTHSYRYRCTRCEQYVFCGMASFLSG